MGLLQRDRVLVSMGGDQWGAPIQGEAETWTMATARRSGSGIRGLSGDRIRESKNRSPADHVTKGRGLSARML